jgi:hypothetical protein
VRLDIASFSAVTDIQVVASRITLTSIGTYLRATVFVVIVAVVALLQLGIDHAVAAPLGSRRLLSDTTTRWGAAFALRRFNPTTAGWADFTW